MSKRVGWENADGEDGDDGEELNEAQQEVRDFANEKKRLKKRREEDDEDGVGQEGNEEERRDEEDDAEGDGGEADVMFSKRGDGTRRIVGVDGEERALYKKTDLADLEKEMGTKLEPFNLHAEMEQGHFDEAGHYIERGFGQSDAWLEQMDLANANVIGGARSRFVKPLDLEEERREEEAPTKPPTTGELAAWGGQLRALMNDEETVAGALKRLAQERRDAHSAQSKKRVGDAQFAKPVARQRGEESGDKDAFDRASSLADKLQNAAQQHSIFSFRKRDLLLWRRGAKVFEYVIRGGEEEQMFGPFSGDAIIAWKQQGYFSSSPVEIRIKVGPNRGRFQPAATFDVDIELGALD